MHLPTEDHLANGALNLLGIQSEHFLKVSHIKALVVLARTKHKGLDCCLLRLSFKHRQDTFSVLELLGETDCRYEFHRTLPVAFVEGPRSVHYVVAVIVWRTIE